MKKMLKNLVKSFPILYSIYFYLFSFFLRVLGLFIKTDENLVLFVCYGGRRYDDSPRFVYEYLKSHPKYQNLKLVWAFENPSQFATILEENKLVKIDTLQYYCLALKAKYWITNSSITRGLRFKKKQTQYIIFQHGTLGIKKIGKDIQKENKSFRIKKEEKIDKFVIQGKKEKPLLQYALDLDEQTICNYGLPRNDELCNYTEEKVLALKKKLNIPLDKKVILYTPTFREYNKDSKLNTYIKLPFNFEKFEKYLAKDYVMLITAHYEVSKLLNIPTTEFVINAFDYPYINDLLLVADVMISDYSSVVFDYCLLERPFFCFGFDYDTYIAQRGGTYTNLDELFYDGVIKSDDELLEHILNMDVDKMSKHTKKIKEEFIENYGNSTKRSVVEIFGERHD